HFQAARAAADTARIAMKRARPTSFWTLDSTAATVETYLRLWQSSADPAEQADLKQACAETLVYLYRLKKAFPICVPRSLLWMGLYLAQEGKSDKAHRYWKRGLSEAQRLELYYDQALLHYEIGRHLMPEHPVRADHLQRAAQLCERIGAAFDGERARAA